MRQVRVSKHRDRQGNGVRWWLESSRDRIYQLSIEHKWPGMIKLARRRNLDRLLQVGGLKWIVNSILWRLAILRRGLDDTQILSSHSYFSERRVLWENIVVWQRCRRQRRRDNSLRRIREPQTLCLRGVQLDICE